MMKVFICPECGWMRVVSRRKDVECFKCGNEQMTLAKVDFDAFTSMSEEERKDYANGWLYICLLYTSPSPRDYAASRMPSSA